MVKNISKDSQNRLSRRCVYNITTPMINALHSFISDIFALLSPEMALAGGVPFPPTRTEKPSFILCKGGGAPSVNLPAPPAPPVINIPAAPTPPPPPPPPSASAADIAAAQQQGAAQVGAGFGYQASLLKAPVGAAGQTGPNGTVNSATGTGSLLGK